jgi:hypothetical protein
MPQPKLIRWQERSPFRVDRQHDTNRFPPIQTQVRRKRRHDELHRRGVIIEKLHPTLEPWRNEFGERQQRRIPQLSVASERNRQATSYAP